MGKNIKNLVIVESPAKAKTIEKYLGKDFSVKSSFGHIRDLPKKGLNIDIENNFQPTYEISNDKKKVVAALKKDAKEADLVWLASDEDREGEAIAWHLCEALKLSDNKAKRIVFHEITKPAIDNAIKNPRTVDKRLVDAQQARRVLDRLVGYELSPVLWKKVRPGLSAGRVQSVAVRLIVEREREIKAHEAESSFKVTAVFEVNGSKLSAELNTRLTNDKAAKKFLESCINATYKITSVEKKPGTRNPGAPFTTSSLQQEAARRLGFSVKQTMTLAQRLYESGNITYMRTDSTILSGQALDAAERYILREFGQKYHQRRQFKTKSLSAQEAHEAIRPTDFSNLSAGSDEQQKKLYNLIWRRAVASQMAPAQTDKTEVRISILPAASERYFVARGEVLRFDGFFKVYGGSKEDIILPEVSNGQSLGLQSMSAIETFSRPSARYSEASLVKKLEELGIGRPSTYAPTISTIQARGYVEKSNVEGSERQVKILELRDSKLTSRKELEAYGADKNKLLPTSVAEVTTDFLVKNFPSIVDYDFTARAEEEFDAIASGDEKWQQIIKEFYSDFHPQVKKSENVSREESTQTRHLGKDLASGKPILARYGRFGPMLQRGETESEEKPDFAPLPEGISLEKVTIEQALEMFKLPRLVGYTADGLEIKANVGRFGPYIQINSPASAGSKQKPLYISIKPHDPMKITETEALELYEAKKQLEANKNIKEFTNGIRVLRGQYGPYVTDGTKNARIPNKQDPAKLTETQAVELLANAATKKKRFTRKLKK